MNLDSGPRSGIVSWYQDVGNPWSIKGHGDRRPQPGSDLAADAADGTDTGPVAHHSIIMALDHLGLVVDAMVRDEPMRHYAPFTSLRTVLLASARARWMLDPDESRERQRRCLQIEFVNIDEQRKAFQTVAGTAATEKLEEEARDILANLDYQVSPLQSRAKDLGTELRKPPDTLSMLRELVGAKAADGFVALHLWRIGSSTAHGYYWSDTQRPDPHLFDDSGFDMAIHAAALFVRQAMATYEHRAGLGRG